MSAGAPHESLPLPQELIDKIIDEFAPAADSEDVTDRAALLACTLVSKSFYARATLHIFSTISVMDEPWDTPYQTQLTERIANLSNIIMVKPAIVKHIHSVTVTALPRFWASPHASSLLIGPHFPAVLSQLSHVRSFQFINRFLWPTIEWARCSNAFLSSVTTIIQSPILTTLSLQSIENMPLSLLSPCLNLKILSLASVHGVLDHTNTSFHPRSLEDIGKLFPPPFHAAFMLESANIREAASLIIPFIHCENSGHNIFARLSQLTLHLYDPVDIWTSKEVVRRASDSLSSLDLANVGKYYNVISPVPINLGELRVLRALKIHTIIYQHEGHLFPEFLFSLLEPSCSTTTMDTLDIRLEWEELDAQLDPFFLQPQYGWMTLDAKLSNGKFPSLRGITIQLELRYRWMEEDLAKIVDGSVEKIHSYLPGLLPITAELLGDGLKYVVQQFLDDSS